MAKQLDFDSLEEFSSQESNSSYASSAFSSQNDPTNNTYFGDSSTNSAFTYYDKNQFCASASSGNNNYAALSLMEPHAFDKVNLMNQQMNNTNYNPTYYNANYSNSYSNYYVSENTASSSSVAAAGFSPYAAMKSIGSGRFHMEIPSVIGAGFDSQNSYSGDFNELANTVYQNQVTPPTPSLDSTANSLQVYNGGICSDKATSDSSEDTKNTAMTPTELDMKLMQKRERNRIAARKCRDKKLNKIKEYETKIQDLQTEIRFHEDDVAKLNARKNHLRLMLINFCCARLNVNSNPQF